AFNTTSSIDITCAGLDDGSISVSMSGGTGECIFTLTPGDIQNSNGEFNALSSGIYQVVVNDENNCGPLTSDAMTINEPPLLVLSITDTTDATSSTANDGAIVASGSGGTGTITFTLSPGDVENSTGEFTGLAPGNYTVLLSDENGCSQNIADIPVNYPSGVRHLSRAGQVTVSPNPFSETFRLIFEKPVQTRYEVEIYDMTGKLMKTRQINLGKVQNKELEMNFTGYPSGVYLLRLKSGELTKYMRVVKE
ncbi:MAG: T9SS type A sorting domain-containing protein, partial [Bacteroidota bacterium]